MYMYINIMYTFIRQPVSRISVQANGFVRDVQANMYISKGNPIFLWYQTLASTT